MKHVIHSQLTRAFYRERGPGERTEFWQPDPERATIFACKRDAERRLGKICSALTRDLTTAIPLKDAIAGVTP